MKNITKREKIDKISMRKEEWKILAGSTKNKKAKKKN